MARRALWILGIGAIAVVAGAVGLAVFALDRAPGWIADRIEGPTGRASRIGSLDVDWSCTPTITLTDLTIANPEWGEAEHLLSVREARFRLRLLPLLTLQIEIPEAVIDGCSVAVERRGDGESNWSFAGRPGDSGADEASGPEERTEVPVIGRLRVTDLALTVRDELRGLDLEGVIATAVGEGGEADRLELSLEGRLEGEPLTIELTGGSVLMLRDSEEPYPLDLAVAFGDTRLTVDGQIDDPIAFQGARIEMTLSGPNLAEVFPLLGIPAPPSPPYELAGRLRRSGEVWEFEGMKGRVGDSDLAGDLAVDYGRETPLLRARLESESLHFRDLAPLVGVDPEADDAGDDGRVLPDVPLAGLERLHAMDMDVELSADRIEAPVFLAMSSLDVRVRVENGRAEAKPLRFGVAGGVVEGSMALNARTEVPSAAADLTFEKLDLAAFFRGTDYYDTMGGEVQGRLELLGSGRSLADLLGSANGSAAAVMTGGAVSGLLIEGAGLDLGEALILVVGDDSNKVPVRCALARVEVQDGRARIERAVVDTSDSVLYVSGVVNLLKQTLGITIEAQAKDFSLLDLDAPVRVDGALGSPDIAIGEGAPIPFLDLGEGEDVPCDELRSEYLRPPEPKGR